MRPPPETASREELRKYLTWLENAFGGPLRLHASAIMRIVDRETPQVEPSLNNLYPAEKVLRGTPGPKKGMRFYNEEHDVGEVTCVRGDLVHIKWEDGPKDTWNIAEWKLRVKVYADSVSV